MTYGTSAPAQLASARREIQALTKQVKALETALSQTQSRYQKVLKLSKQRRLEMVLDLAQVEEILLSQSPLHAVALVRELKSKYDPTGRRPRGSRSADGK